jgi:hypothetical protein
MSIQPGMSQN